MDPDTPKATLAAHYQSVWEKLLPKWRDKADLREVFAPRTSAGPVAQNGPRTLRAGTAPAAAKGGAEVQRASSIKVRRRRGGAQGLGQGRPGWFTSEAIAVLGNRHCRFGGGIPAGRLLSALMQAPTGDLPEAAQRYFHPFTRLRANTGADLSVMSVYRLAVTEPVSCHHGFKALFLSRPLTAPSATPKFAKTVATR